MTALSLSPLRIQDSALRIKLTASVALYGAALGSAAILVSIIARTGHFELAEHLAFTPGLITALTGAIAVTLITPLAIYHLRDTADESGSLLLWLALGLGFGVASSFVAGALFPLNAVFITFAEGEIAFGEIPSLVAEGALQGIRSFFIDGALAIYTWFLAGALFGIGGWIIDKFNASPNAVASKYGTWAFAIFAGLILVAIASFGPPETLRTFG
ncbi:MAG: hypothetical protein HOA06_09030 [Chloroflexi bacterium]|jgi:hypothetical protein|nr:hypothetical protein [Chloroflexota bacterium]